MQNRIKHISRKNCVIRFVLDLDRATDHFCRFFVVYHNIMPAFSAIRGFSNLHSRLRREHEKPYGKFPVEGNIAVSTILSEPVLENMIGLWPDRRQLPRTDWLCFPCELEAAQRSESLRAFYGQTNGWTHFAAWNVLSKSVALSNEWAIPRASRDMFDGSQYGAGLPPRLLLKIVL